MSKQDVNQKEKVLDLHGNLMKEISSIIEPISMQNFKLKEILQPNTKVISI